MQVVMMNVLWGELTMSGVALNIESSIWNVVPSGLGFVGEHNVAAVVPLEPSPESLGKHPGVVAVWALMQPVIEWTFEAISPGGDMAWELTVKSWDDVIELQGVGAQMNPSRVGSEDSQSISWPETVMLVPAGNIWLSLLHVSDEVVDVEEERGNSVLLLDVLSENRRPLLAGDLFIDGLVGSGNVHLGVDDRLGNGNVRLKLLVSLIVPVVKGSSIKVDNTGASIHVVNGCCESNLGTETVTSHGGHGDLLVVHKSNNVGRDILKRKVD
jgi:hypothetical protein